MRKSVIGIDNISPGLSTGENAHGGMRSYLRDLSLYLPKALPDEKFVLFTPAWNPILLKEEQPDNLQTVVLYHVPKSRLLRVAFEQVILPSQMAAAGIKTWIGTANVLPLAAGCSQI